MKNIQIIDGADNCSYLLFAATEEEFKLIFPGDGQDIEFIEDVVERLSEKRCQKIFAPIWKRPIDKPCALGIHGTLFYQLYWKKKYYPTKREKEMKFVPASRE